jgi:tetratricopeptide (TPR) repeat protein
MFRKIRLHFKIKSGKFKEALALIPPGDNIEVTYLLLRAHCNFRLQLYDKAKQDLDKVKEATKDPYDLYTAYNNQGYFFLEQGLWDQAIAELTKARELQPKKSFALDNLGYAYLFTNRIEEGVKMVEEAFKMNRQNYYAIRNMGIYYMHKKQYTDALVVLEKAKAKDKKIDDIDVFIAICQSKTANDDQLTKIIQRFSNFQRARFEKLISLFP